MEGLPAPPGEPTLMRVSIRFQRGACWLAAAVLAGTTAATMSAADAYTRADSTSMRQKIERIVQTERTVAPLEAFWRCSRIRM